jgi:hypothetical protein
MAVVVAGARLGINPFDQPNVEAAKILAREMVATYQKQGTLPELAATMQDEDLTVYGSVAAATPVSALAAFLDQAEPGAYVAIQAYVPPNPATDAAMHELRSKIRARTQLATTVGYGPRFLHSTGQLHKGDGGNGIFIQLSSDNGADAQIPDEAGKSDTSISFGVLQEAQALGDRQALLDGSRKVIRFHISGSVPGQVGRLAESL